MIERPQFRDREVFVIAPSGYAPLSTRYTERELGDGRSEYSIQCESEEAAIRTMYDIEGGLLLLRLARWVL